jgi:hypothetical protein
MLLTALAAIVVVAIAGGGIFELSQNSRRTGAAPASAPATSAPAASAPATTAPATAFATPTETTTAEPTSTPTPAASFWTRGYSTPELAIDQFVNDQGYVYGGDCRTAPKSADYCSTSVGKVTSGTVYALGGIGAKAEVWVLLRKVGGKWYVVDVVSAASPPPWP